MDILQKRLLETPAIMITTTITTPNHITITTKMITITITTATSHFASCLLPADKGSSSPSRVTDRGPTEILYDIIHFLQCNGIKLKYDGMIVLLVLILYTMVKYRVMLSQCKSILTEVATGADKLLLEA